MKLKTHVYFLLFLLLFASIGSARTCFWHSFMEGRGVHEGEDLTYDLHFSGTHSVTSDVVKKGFATLVGNTVLVTNEAALRASFEVDAEDQSVGVYSYAEIFNNPTSAESSSDLYYRDYFQAAGSETLTIRVQYDFSEYIFQSGSGGGYLVAHSIVHNTDGIVYSFSGDKRRMGNVWEGAWFSRFGADSLPPLVCLGYESSYVEEGDLANLVHEFDVEPGDLIAIDTHINAFADAGIVDGNTGEFYAALKNGPYRVDGMPGGGTPNWRARYTVEVISGTGTFEPYQESVLPPEPATSDYSSFYYSYDVSGGELNSNDEFAATVKSNEGLGYGALSGEQIATGWIPMPSDQNGPKQWMIYPGTGHGEVRYSIDSDQGELHGFLKAEARYSSEDTARAQSSLEMGCRQYYRAVGSEPLTVRVNFQYDGTHRSDYLHRIGLGVYVTRVLNESVYFSEFTDGLHLWMMDLPEGVDLYDNKWKDKQTIAETKQVYLTNNSGGGIGDPANETRALEFTVNPGELFTVDTMFDAYITSSAQTSDSEGKIDFSNTAKSSIELVSGDGSIIFATMPAIVYPRDYTYITTNSEVIIKGYTGNPVNVQIPATIDGYPVVRIEEDAFYDCTNLVNMTLPEGLTTIGAAAFGDCYNLRNIVIPSTVTNIGDYAFVGCTNLTEITIPAGVTYLADGVFSYCSGLTRVIVPEGVTSLGEELFYECTGLLSVTIPISVTNIGAATFGDCSSLTELSIPSGVRRIGEYAFSCCDALTSVYFRGDAPDQDGALFEESFGAIVYHSPASEGWGSAYDGQAVSPWNPKVQTGVAGFGVQANGFGFSITHSNDLTVIVEESTSLTNPAWTPIGIHTLSGGTARFNDPSWTNHPSRFYRLRMP